MIATIQPSHHSLEVHSPCAPGWAPLCKRHRVTQAQLESVLRELCQVGTLPDPCWPFGLCIEGLCVSPHHDWPARGCRAAEVIIVPWVHIHEALGRAPAGATLAWLAPHTARPN